MSLIERHFWVVVAIVFIAAIAIGVFSGEKLFERVETVCRHGYLYDPYYEAQVIGENGGGIPCGSTAK